MSVRSVTRPAYPFTSHWMDLPEGRIHYVDEGTGEPILFLHGTPTWSYEWRHLIRVLGRRYRCIAPDLLGFGLSDRPSDFPYTPEAHAAVFASFVERLRTDAFTLVLHDFGGPVGLPVCLERPEAVKRLVLINTWMWSFADDREMVRKARVAGGAVGRFLYRWGNLPLRVLLPYAFGDREKLTDEVHREYLDRFPDRESREQVLWPLARAILGSSDFYDSLWRQREKLRDRSSLIIWGMKDPAFQPNQLARWREVLPDADVVTLKDAGHWPHEEQPDHVVRAVDSFISGGRKT